MPTAAERKALTEALARLLEDETTEEFWRALNATPTGPDVLTEDVQALTLEITRRAHEAWMEGVCDTNIYLSLLELAKSLVPFLPMLLKG